MRVCAALCASACGTPPANNLRSMRCAFAATGLSASARACEASLTACASCFITLGKWSRYSPVADSTTSTRGRPSGSRGISFTPVTRPPASHTGSTPSAHSACASSRPKWRIASTDHSVKASLAGLAGSATPSQKSLPSRVSTCAMRHFSSAPWPKVCSPIGCALSASSCRWSCTALTKASNSPAMRGSLQPRSSGMRSALTPATNSARS